MESQDSIQRNIPYNRQSQDEEDSGNQRKEDDKPEDNNSDNWKNTYDSLLDLISFLSLYIKRYKCEEWKHQNLKFSDLAKASNSDNKLKYDEIEDCVKNI